ncbi:hypothetical protein Holit_00268 [Hollandina sp. SP2]
MPLSWNEIRLRAAAFSTEWEEKAFTAREEAVAQTFQTDFLNVFGVTRRQVATFESRVKIGGQADLFGEPAGGRRGYIDLFWKGHIIIEMKTPGKDLKKAYRQAKEYAAALPPSDLPVGILIGDFVTFEYYDLDKSDKPVCFTLKALPEYVELFGYLAGYKDVVFKEISPVDIEAAEHMGRLHDELKKIGYSGHELEMYLVRLLFCLFADDTGIFPRKKMFFEYLRQRTTIDGSDLALHLGMIFDTLNKDVPDRLKNLDEQLKAFPYVDGGLFAERLETASFSSEMRRLLLECCALDWSKIKPEIFGALFQSVKDKEKRRALGEHYTSETNILKLINPLFVDILWAEFEKIKGQAPGGRKDALLKFHDTLCRLKFLDPACGCGNFLVVSYRELRLLEIEVIKEYLGLENVLDIEMMVRVNVNQFYGIEIEEFPARIAQTALWLMDHLMNNKASEVFGRYIVRIPLTVSPSIVIGNALSLDWEEIVPKTELSYILGNPPFLGYSTMGESQKAEVVKVFDGMKGCAMLDYVTCWYKKSALYMQGTEIEAAFVSTNSICQGGQVPILWPELLNKHGIIINFAHQTFKWKNEAKGMAAVYCVIIGFSRVDRVVKKIYHYATVTSKAVEAKAGKINAYLIDAPAIFIERRSDPLCKVSPMLLGNVPRDDGNFFFDRDERAALLKADPGLEHVIRPFLGAYEFINRIDRYCLWLDGIPPKMYHKSKVIMHRLSKIRAFREGSTREGTVKYADLPALFTEIRQPENDYILVPLHSSERRKYIPIGFISKDIICGNSNAMIPNATLYEFGVLTSAFHMAWMRCVCGRLELRYRYSGVIVYNNFPWPSPTAKQKEAIEKNAQAVLDARDKYPDSSLAVLYDPDTMPSELVKAHQKLDKAVEKAYGKTFTNDADRVARLFYLYQTLTEGLLAKKVRRKNI